MSKPSATPITDEHATTANEHDTREFIPVDIAREKLEKPLNEANARIKELQNDIAGAVDAFKRIREMVGATDQDAMPCEVYVERKLRDAEADKRRLDWLNTIDGMDWFSCLDYGEATRATIDKAMPPHSPPSPRNEFMNCIECDGQIRDGELDVTTSRHRHIVCPRVLAERITNFIYESYKGRKVTRIQCKSGLYPDEKDEGGYCRDAFLNWVTKIIEGADLNK